LNFLDRFEKKNSNIAKICPVGDDWFHANRRRDRWTDGRAGRQAGRGTGIKKLIDTFRNFVNASKEIVVDIKTR